MLQKQESVHVRLTTALGLALMTGFCPIVAANTLCVNPGGANGCKATINAAITAAAPGDTIKVAHGTYKEGVVIPKSLSLIGENKENTIVDATDQDWGVNIDGHGNPGLSDVVVSGFTIENAKFAGVLVTNASSVTISDNEVINNDKGLVTTGSEPACPGLPAYFQKGENLDCGEGIMFSGADHSILSGNHVTGNSGGMLITDDTGATHDNLIAGNEVVHNTHFDCGITLPSHSGMGVYNNTVAGNDSSYNGGPGVGIFAPGPGTRASGNVVINNKLTNNGLPGVAMHNHAAPGVNGVPAGAPPVNFNDNLIVGNQISGNAADEEDTATAGPTGINIASLAPMKGTVITGNIIDKEAIDIAVRVPGLAGGIPAVQIHLNNLIGKAIGVDNLGTELLDATMNWWGCPGGPGANGCSTIGGTGVAFTPWLTNPIQADN